jgi:hypothetical protein
MNRKQFLARSVNPLLLLAVLPFSPVAHGQQTVMPLKSEDRPLKDRIASMERAERDVSPGGKQTG